MFDFCHLVNYAIFNARLTLFEICYDNLTFTKTT